MQAESPLTSLARRAGEQLAPIVDRTVATLRKQVPGYSPGEGLSESDIREVLTGYLTEVLQELAGAPRRSPPAYEQLMRRRAEEGITLTDMLHSYRIGVSLLWEGLADLADGDDAAQAALIGATPFLFEVLDRYSLRANEIHHEIALRAARRAGQVRASLLDLVLAADSSPSPAFWEAVDRLGIPRSGHFAVVQIMEPSDGPAGGAGAGPPPDYETPIAAQASVQAAWFRVGPHSQAGIIAFTRADEAMTADALSASSAREAIALGVSSPFTSIADAAKAHAQARVAVAAAAGSRRLVRYNHDLLAVLLASAPEAAATLVTETFAGIAGLPEERRFNLLQTVRVWLSLGQSVARTADAMHCHRNTVNYRLRHFQDLAGRSFSDNAWLAQVVLALEAETAVRR